MRVSHISFLSHLFELRPHLVPFVPIDMAQDPNRALPDSQSKIRRSELEEVEEEDHPAFFLSKVELKLLGIAGVRISLIILASYLTLTPT